MGFWIFITICNLLIPFTMLGFGKYFIKNAPKEINGGFGYRTTMSMKNKDTWKFAHNYCGKVWFFCGVITLVLAIITMTFVVGRNNNIVGTVGGIISGIEIIFLMGSIFPTERALKKKFDENGKLR